MKIQQAVFVLLLILVIGISSKIVEETYFTDASEYQFHNTYFKCLGRYCGRNIITYPPINETLNITLDGVLIRLNDECTTCNQGYFSDGWICIPCETQMTFYDIFFILWVQFYVFFNGFLHLRSEYKEHSFWLRGFFYFIQVAETSIAATASFFLFGLHMCPITSINDFYPLFFNPPNVECTSERFYPFFSIVYIFYVFSIILLFVRLLFVILLFRKKKKIFTPILYQLYFIPFCCAIYFVLCGCLYYSYPYVGIILLSFSTITMIFDDDKIYFEIFFSLTFRSVVIWLCLFAIFNFFFPFLWWIIFPALIAAVLGPFFVITIKVVITKYDLKKKVKRIISGLVNYVSNN